MSSNERLQALKILMAVVENKSSLAQLMPAAAQNTPLTKELCFGVCRHFIRLQAIAGLLLDKKPKDSTVWLVLLLGLYQLVYLQHPDYAVVKETVSLLDKVKKTWAKGLVNAVFRTFCRKRHELLESLTENEDYLYGHPQGLLKHFKRDWPNDWKAITAANDTHPPMTLRVNLSKTSTEEYMQRLLTHGLAAQRHPVVPSAVVLSTPCGVADLPGFAQGEVSVQDAAAQIAVSLLDLKPGLRVLDACCAPGGKTCHILETEPNLAACVAVDIEPRRIERVKENLTRLNLMAELVQGDALHPEQWWDKQPFDRILLDAPCSATGVIRRHADIKLIRSEEEILAIQKIQQQMLQALWPLLAPGGFMVYATCSIIKEENEKQIASFVARQKDCKLIDGSWSWGRATGYGQQILPGELMMDGFFYSLLLKEQS
jgi:16S rRNA (cytosine967-C5)-methyltransferase